MLKQFSIVVLLIISFSGFAQYPTNPVKSTSTKDRLAAVKQRKKLRNQSLYLGVEAKNIGPTIMSGRVVDLAVDPTNSHHFFVAYATGGVWETKNNGQSFDPIFDKNGYTNNCGALAADWENKILYVGTGEANSSRSSYAGYGVFKSPMAENSSNWQSWEYIGLAETQHIGRIIIDPKNSNKLYVAAVGNLFSPNKERGVYITSDGGKTWTQSLAINDNTGAIDLEINPKDPNQIMVAMWERTRRAWNFWEGGEGSGIYISKDAGKSWTRSSTFPQNKKLGRIGLSISNDGTVYGLLDNQNRTTKPKKTEIGLNKKSFRDMTVDSFQNLTDSVLNKFLKDNRFPEKYNSKKLQKLVRKGELKPLDLFNYLTDSNAALFEDPVIGAELYRSNDFGKTWNKTHQEDLEKVAYSYGYYFGTVSTNPSNSAEVFIAGVPLLKSLDSGKTFQFAGGENVHVDHHSLWINPNNHRHLINGNDGGINISYDGGENWIKCNSPAVGQFYTVQVDNNKNYNVYGGLQDNGVWKGPNTYSYSKRWKQEGNYPYTRLLGGDGMRIEVDSRDHTVYSGYQFGHYYRISKNGKRKYIHPMPDLKEPHLRWNWQTPILLSSHNQDIMYMGSNKLHRSMNNGEQFSELSNDLTLGAKTGDVSYGTITHISESPLKFGLLYVGSDDGVIQRSKDGGNSWVDVTGSLPKSLWVKRVLGSRHNEGRVYAILNGHNWDHFDSYIYCSDDFGDSWNRIGKTLPAESVNVIIEDTKNENTLYIGTDAGLYISTNQGEDFEVFSGLPIVPVHDLAIQDESYDLVVATHGRSLFKVQLEPLNSYEKNKSDFILLKPQDVVWKSNWGEKSYNWETIKPKIELSLFTPYNDDVTCTLTDSLENEIASETFKVEKGFNTIDFVLFDSDVNLYPSKGEHSINCAQNYNQTSVKFQVK